MIHKRSNQEEELVLRRRVAVHQRPYRGCRTSRATEARE